ncbi:hypothetical protein [Caudoviricetes sp.]|nr:hypothetical protein [Caudoviricetes sp.]
MLEAVSPKSDNLAWLHLAWEPGEGIITVDGDTFDQRVERWVLWQVQPIQFVAAHIVKELQGPHPRSTGQWRPYTRGDGSRGVRWFGGAASVITKQQWELYRETGGYATAWWVVQGDKGGHRVSLSPPEMALYAAEFGVGLNDVEVPRMGQLPYADFDQRVLDAIAAHDHLSQFAGMAGLGSRYGEFLLRALADKEEQARAKAYDNVFVGAADEYADELSWHLRREQPAWRPVATDEKDTFDADAARESYIRGTLGGGHVDTIKHTL